MLVSSVQQNDSVIHKHVSILFQIFSHLGYYRILSSVPCALQRVLVECILYFFIFNWSIITLYSSDGFCHTSTWISHRHTHVPSLWNLTPTPSPFQPLGCYRALAWSSLHLTANSHWLSILHMVMCMFQYCSLKSSHPLPSSLWAKVCSLSLYLLCCLANRFIITVFLDSIWMH